MTTPAIRTALLHHPDCDLHRMQPGHPECPERIHAILDRLESCGLGAELIHLPAAAAATDGDLERVHPPEHVARLRALSARGRPVAIDQDTLLGPGSLQAALAAAGSAVAAVDGILSGDFERAFCAVRPPGHHAESNRAMGFCFFNSMAVAARRALDAHGLSRLAILDFDVHHGNGTTEIFADEPRVLVCSSFQHPFYPGRMIDVARDHIVLTPLAAGSGSTEFRRAIGRDWIPAVERHQPEMILVSAGFDAHRSDPLAELELTTDDFRWVTELICGLASPSASDRILSMLEGGYDLTALADAAEAHVRALIQS